MIRGWGLAGQQNSPTFIGNERAYAWIIGSGKKTKKKTIVRSALSKIAAASDDVECNLLVQFRTRFPGVVLPPDMRDQYPEDMTIALTDSFWNLTVDKDRFSVDVLFDDVKQTIKVPFDALMFFNDVEARFEIVFDWENAPVPTPGDNIILFSDIQKMSHLTR
jgi:hypothetical protein